MVIYIYIKAPQGVLFFKEKMLRLGFVLLFISNKCAFPLFSGGGGQNSNSPFPHKCMVLIWEKSVFSSHHP